MHRATLSLSKESSCLRTKTELGIRWKIGERKDKERVKQSKSSSNGTALIGEERVDELDWLERKSEVKPDLR